MTLATGYACRIELDSICEQTKCRLTTFVVSYPRFVHAEMMTHRMFSRNSASSRAIPTHKMIEVVRQNPAIPIKFLKRAEKGMQPAGAIDELEVIQFAKSDWLYSRDAAVSAALRLEKLEIAKEQVNRLLEPFLWHTTIITATDFQNFFKLRCHPDAQQEIQVIARMMREAYEKSNPRQINPGGWHCPFTTEHDYNTYTEDGKTVGHCSPLTRSLSAARCARISYLTHEGIRDHDKDLELFNRLTSSGHWSPLEHVARAEFESDYVGNFRGWTQYRKMFDNEYTKG